MEGDWAVVDNCSSISSDLHVCVLRTCHAVHVRVNNVYLDNFVHGLADTKAGFGVMTVSHHQ